MTLPSAELVTKSRNKSVPFFCVKRIVREPFPANSLGVSCKEMIYPEDNSWQTIGWFSSSKSYADCKQKCERFLVSPLNCPCKRFFRGED